MAYIPQKPAGSTSLPSLDQLTQRGLNLTSYSSTETAQAAGDLAFEATPTKTFYDLYKRSALEASEKVTEQEFNQTLAPRYGITWKEGLERNELDWDIKRKARQAIALNQSTGDSEGLRSAFNFVAASFLDPINVAAAYATGGTSNITKFYTAAGHSRKAAALATTNQFVKLFGVQAAVEVPYAYSRQSMGEEYTADHLSASLAMNTLFSAGFSGLKGYKVHKQASNNNYVNMKYKAFKDLMDGSRASGQFNPATVISAVADNASPQIAKLIKENPRLKDISEGRIKESDFTAQDIIDIERIGHMHETTGMLQNISMALADDYITGIKDTKGSIRSKWNDYQSRLRRYEDAVNTRNTSNLTPEDLAWLQKHGKVEVDPSTSIVRSRATERAEHEVSYQQSRSNPVKKDAVNKIIDDYIETGDPALVSQYNKLVVNTGAGLRHKQVVKMAEGLINKHFLGAQSGVKLELAENPLEYYKKLGQRPKASYNYVTDKIEFGDQSAYLKDRSYETQVINTAFHEFTHRLEFIPEARKLQAIAKKAGVKQELDFEIEARGYVVEKGFTPGSIVAERAPVLMEWAITRPEFWKTLYKDDKELYNKLKAGIVDLTNDLRKYLVGSADNIDDGLLVKGLDAIQKKTPIAQEVAEVIRELKSVSNSANIFKNIVEQNDFGRLVRNEGAGDDISFQGARPAYENPNIKARVSELERYNADPKQYLTDEIITTLGDETILPTIQRMPKISAGEAGRKEHIARVQEALNEKGFDNLSSKYGTILLNLQGSSARLAKVRKIIRQDPSSKNFLDNLVDLQEAGMPPEMLSRVGSILLDGNLTAAQKLGKVNTFFEQEDLAMILRFVHNDAIRTSLGTQAKVGSGKKARLAQLKTMLDGNLRPDVTRGPSIQAKLRAQIENDQAPILDYLSKNELRELFLGEDQSKYMAQYFGQKTDATGTPLVEASQNLHRDIMKSIMAGEPQGLIKGIPELEGLVDVIKTINRGQLAEINRLGINMRESKNFTGYSVRYDRELVASMEVDEFVTYMMNVVDLKETARLHGGVMNNYTEGVLDGVKKFAPKAFFKGMHREIVDGTFIDDGSAANKSIAGAMRKSAKIAFRDQTKAEALIKFSNFKNLGRLLFDQVRSRSEKIALIKNLGHDPYTMLMDVARDLQVMKTPGFKTFDMTAKQVTGMLDNPVDAVFANNFQKLRAVSNIIYLPTASLSALSDIPLTMTTLDYLGAKVPFSQFMKRYKSAIDMAFRGKKKDMNAWFLAQGAGFDIITRTIGQRVVTGEALGTDLAGKANQVQFELTGLNRITATTQIMFLDVVSERMAIELRAMKDDSVLLARMREFGFTTADLNHLAKHVAETPDGIERAAPSNVVNPKVQLKLRAFYSQYMREAVMEPDAGAQAMSRLGFESGTIKGEAARTAFQYSSFMLGMSRVVYRRFAHGYSGEGKHNAMAMSHLIAYLGTAIGFAYITTVMKDISRGKEPIDITNMTQFDFNRLISQSGVLGIGDLAFNAVRFKDPMAMFSPVAGQAVDLATGDLESFLEPFKGEQYPIIGPILQQAVGFVAGETINAVQSDLEENILDTE